MATKQEVKEYLAYWFQLGKKVVVGNGKATFLPQPVLKGDRYSVEFEECWQTILCHTTGDCYLEGTDETIRELLTPAWEVSACGRCQMPVPMRSLGMPALLCPCNDLPNWPNTELPAPRSPISNQEQLMVIRERLQNAHNISTTNT
ncbi:hypothetical protein [Nodularia spumigena]|uniref:hypothetical protein n=1 Tax=Nodularia spumigena TaxID=70799 RepID=UPI00232D59E2|nr:hypothetical protein [Nodularia spumigena]MDB9319709.1 hypothetical protein [Nodularia spumigena CS-590/01A]MDB9328453.1 hypothetical protein [Nodularia spumigena CS-590/02]MDB9334270.1 hypothetical protein [Nodularia spumigena CS-590/01]